MTSAAPAAEYVHFDQREVTLQAQTRRAVLDWRAISMMLPLSLLAVGAQLTAANPGLAVDRAMPAISVAQAESAVATADAKPTFDVDRVVDQTTHAIRAVAGQPGALTVPGADYATTFDATGVEVDGLHLAFDAVARAGAAPLAIEPGAWTPEVNVAERAVAAGVAERVTASAAGVEWDVILHHAPAGTGALTVTAQLDGIAAGSAPKRIAEGWQLATASGSTVTIDELVVLDATGAERYRALPAIDGDELRLAVPADVLDEAAYPLTLDPTVAPARLVSGKRTSGEEQELDIAFDGTNFLVVWNALNDGIYGTRVTPGGVVLDIPAIEIESFNTTLTPSVAFDGTNYFVVWGNTDGIGGRLVTPAGVVGSPVQVTSAANAQYDPDVTFAGSAYLVVWEDRRSGTADIYGARVTTAGGVLDPTGLAISTAAGAQDAVSVAYDGTNSMVVWSDARAGTRDIFGARVGPGGGISDPAGIPISTATNSQYEPALAFDGTNYLVVWDDARSGTSEDIYGSRVSPAGGVLNISGIAISTASGDQGAPAVAFDGTNHLVVWEDKRTDPSPGAGTDVYATRVTPAGVVSTPAGTAVATSEAGAGIFSFDPTVAAGGGTFLTGWEDTRSLTDAWGTRISPAGVVQDAKGLRFSVDLVGSGQSQPAVAFDGTNYLVVWSNYVGTLDVFGARVAPNGRLIDPDAFSIAGGVADQLEPAVAFGGGQFLVTWTDRRSGNDDIYSTKVSTAGVVASPSGVPVATGTPPANTSAVAWNGSRFLVTWMETRVLDTTIYAARIDGTGVQDATGIQLSPTGSFEDSPAVASNGSEFLVTWSNGGSSIAATRVTNAGTEATPEFLVGDRTGFQFNPTVAFDGTNYLVAYEQAAPTGERDVYGTRVSQTGTVLDGVTTGIAIRAGAGDQVLPQVAFNGSYLVIWTQRNGATEDEFYGARVATNGAVSDPTPFLIGNGGPSTGTFPVRAAAITKGPGGEWGVVQDRSYAGVYLREVAPK